VTHRKEPLGRLIHEIYSLQRTLRCASASSLEPGDPGTGLLDVMRILRDHANSRATTLAARMGIGVSALSRHLAELEDMGWVQREPDPEDRRASLVSLTPAGLQRLNDIAQRKVGELKEVLSGWTDAEVQEALDVITRLDDALSQTFRPGAVDGAQPHHHTASRQTIAASHPTITTSHHTIPATLGGGQ